MHGWLSLIQASSTGWIPLLRSPLPSIPTFQNRKKINEEKTCINVSGTHFETWQSTLDKYPYTLLGSSEREYFYDSQQNEYFFDRDPIIFRYILNYYRTGHLHFPRDECVSVYEMELDFFGIKLSALDVCCYEDFVDKKKEDTEKALVIDEKKVNTRVKFKTIRERLWNDFEDPHASVNAQAVYYITGFFIALSVLTNIVETVSCSVSETTGLNVACGVKYEHAFFCLDTACVLIFTIEYLARLYSAPNRWKLMKSAMSIIDVVAVLPYYVGLFMTTSLSGAFTTLRVFRVCRIFKFSRHSQGLRILGYTLKSCVSEFGFLLFSMSMAIIIFATIMFYAEKSESSQFTSIPAAFWYTIVTMTTLGYGDIVPVTVLGKIFGGICSLSGVLVIALPVPVIVSNFSRIYQQSQKNDKQQQQQASKKARMKYLERERETAFIDDKKEAETELECLLNNNVSNEKETVFKNVSTENSVTDVGALSKSKLQHFYLISCLESLVDLKTVGTTIRYAKEHSQPEEHII